MHTLLFLDPGHFHAALTFRVPHPRVADDVFVYAPDGPELRDFLALVDRFNRRPDDPTRWRPVVTTAADPLARLLADGRGDAVVLAGRNGGKARTIRRLHDAGLHVLADKPWLVNPEDLDDIRPVLAGWPLGMEITTARHDVTNQVLERLVHARDVVGDFRDDAPAVELASTHCLEKLVDGAPLRRPAWFFDVRVQGSGAVDIPTHLVDQTQRLVADADEPELLRARAWPTPVPEDAFRRLTGHATFPPDLAPLVEDGALRYLCNAELTYRIGRVTARATARWALTAPPGGGDASRVAAHGTRADVVLEQSVHTGHRRRVVVTPRGDGVAVARALHALVAAAAAELPGISVAPAPPDGHEILIPDALRTGHEAHFALVLDEFLRAIDDHRWPASLARRTRAKYALLAEAAARTVPAGVTGASP